MYFNLQQLRKEAKGCRKILPRVSEKLLALCEVAKSRENRGCFKEVELERVALRFGISSRTLRRWMKAYWQKGVEGLVPSKVGGRKGKPIRGHLAKKIKKMRQQYRWGAEVIQAHIQRNCGSVLSQYRIHKFLRKNGFIKIKRRKRKNKHTKVVKIERPGAFTQVDVKHLPNLLTNGKKCYVYNFVDHASKWQYKWADLSFGPWETKRFLEKMMERVPFKIEKIQSDNGVEFTFRFVSHLDEPKKHSMEIFCENNGIRHKLIPVGEKELQGLVERSNRQDKDELYHRIRPPGIKEFRQELEKHCERVNKKRLRKCLGWKSSLEWLEDYYKRTEQEKKAA
jgi:transposase